MFDRIGYCFHLELISTEIRYVDLLVVIRDVFLRAFPPRSATSLRLSDNLFPYLDVVLEGHTRLLFFMLEAHNTRPDHVTANLGQCFIKTVSYSLPPTAHLLASNAYIPSDIFGALRPSWFSTEYQSFCSRGII